MLERYCESKHQIHLEKRNQEHHDCHLDKQHDQRPQCNSHAFAQLSESTQEGSKDRTALERLMRNLSPTGKYSVSNHTELFHILYNCPECSLKVNFCARCSTKTSEFFTTYTQSELQSLYGRDLPPPDQRMLDAFGERMKAREHEALSGLS